MRDLLTAVGNNTSIDFCKCDKCRLIRIREVRTRHNSRNFCSIWLGRKCPIVHELLIDFKPHFFCSCRVDDFFGCDFRVNKEFLIWHDIRACNRHQCTPHLHESICHIHTLDNALMNCRIIDTGHIVVEIIEIFSVKFSNSDSHNFFVKNTISSYYSHFFLTRIFAQFF